MSPAPLRMLALLAALAAGPAPAFAQATAEAGASALIVEPAGLTQAAAGSSAAAALGPGVAQISGGSFSIQGPANQVVSVSTTLPSSLERVGGGQTLVTKGVQVNASRILSPAGGAAFDVAAEAPRASAAGGIYAGAAEVLVKLN